MRGAQGDEQRGAGEKRDRRVLTPHHAGEQRGERDVMKGGQDGARGGARPLQQLRAQLPPAPPCQSPPSTALRVPGEEISPAEPATSLRDEHWLPGEGGIPASGDGEGGKGGWPPPAPFSCTQRPPQAGSSLGRARSPPPLPPATAQLSPCPRRATVTASRHALWCPRMGSVPNSRGEGKPELE